ncbi:hypothetical protein K431DRAFT_289625 [Polychaeton citri CBS 116435]|uniref:Uncharacterized protein n=1 Tax=Polychaeton citri CBS 116435 TaxID=1314669 RepID=A0A9P4PYI9_9PEZI|nr:hypothetical protein K431DRAFT_289625 [Polychaeton citri CBS 116435]
MSVLSPILSAAHLLCPAPCTNLLTLTKIGSTLCPGPSTIKTILLIMTDKQQQQQQAICLYGGRWAGHPPGAPSQTLPSPQVDMDVSQPETFPSVKCDPLINGIVREVLFACNSDGRRRVGRTCAACRVNRLQRSW